MAPTSSAWLVFSQWLRGIHQHIGDVLDVPHLPFAAANLKQRVVSYRMCVGRIE